MTPSAPDSLTAALRSAANTGHHPTITELGGETAIVDAAPRLITDPHVDIVAAAVVGEWNDQDSSNLERFLADVIAACPPVAARSTLGILAAQLPAQAAWRLASPIISNLDDRHDAPGMVRAAESVWALVTMAMRNVLPAEQVWAILAHCGEPGRPEFASSAGRALQRLYRDSPDHRCHHIFSAWATNPACGTDAHNALGWLNIDDAIASDDAERLGHLERASTHFSTALDIDAEHDIARTGDLLSRTWRQWEHDGSIDTDLADQLGAAVRTTCVFSHDATRSALPLQTQVAWLNAIEALAPIVDAPHDVELFIQCVAAALEAEGAASVGVDDLVLPAATRAVRARWARTIALNALTEAASFPGRDTLIDTLATNDSDDPADMLAVAAHRLRDADSPAWSVVADLATPGANAPNKALERQLDRLLADLQDDDWDVLEQGHVLRTCWRVVTFLADRTNRSLTPGNSHLRYLTMLRRDGVTPLEAHLQGDFSQLVSAETVVGVYEDEVQGRSRGRVDGTITMPGTQIAVEFKREPDDSTPEALDRYLTQPSRYASHSINFSVLLVLDVTDDCVRYTDVASQTWIRTIEPATPHGRIHRVLVGVLPANLETPSEEVANNK